jgi:hypothetical protein
MLNDIFGSPAVAAAARQLYAAAEASTKAHAEERLEEFFTDAARSDVDFETAFLATQMLRDLDRIDDSIALHVFDTLIENLRGNGPSTGPSAADVYRSRGETGLAQLIESDPVRYRAHSAAGGVHLMSMKQSTKVRGGIDDPKDLTTVSKYTLALMAAPEDERRAEWNTFVRAIKTVSVDGAVRVIRSLRDEWKLSPADYASLIDTIIGESVEMLIDEDCEIQRLGDDAGVAAKGPKKRLLATPDEERRSLRRSARIKAAFLRRLHEHELANLLLSDLDAYDALVNESTKTRV